MHPPLGGAAGAVSRPLRFAKGASKDATSRCFPSDLGPRAVAGPVANRTRRLPPSTHALPIPHHLVAPHGDLPDRYPTGRRRKLSALLLMKGEAFGAGRHGDHWIAFLAATVNQSRVRFTQWTPSAFQLARQELRGDAKVAGFFSSPMRFFQLPTLSRWPRGLGFAATVGATYVCRSNCC